MPSRPSLPRLAAVLLTCSLAFPGVACVPGGAEVGEVIGVHAQPIKDGQKAPEDRAVVGISDFTAGMGCTGSLLAPNVVLTARHCVSEIDSKIACGDAKPGPLRDADQFLVTTEPTLGASLDKFHPVREVIGLPFDPGSPSPLVNKEDLCGRDMAILVLGENVDPAEAVPLVPRVDSALVANEEYSALGFGATDAVGFDTGTRRRRDDLFVECVADACLKSNVKATEFLGDSGVCLGDSGGPALDKQGRVAGVISRGSKECGAAVFGHVVGWGAWVKEVVLYAAQPSIGDYPAPAWARGFATDPAYSGPVGTACDAATCTSDICVDSGTELGEHCTRKCDAFNVCPDGFECYDELRVCIDDASPTLDPESNQGGGCGVVLLDPTKPIPWRSGAAFAGAVGAFALRRRRRRS